MSEPQLDRLRALRSRSQALLRFAESDLRPFLHRLDKVTFRRTPGSPSLEKDVNVTTTCSCLMALAVTDSFPHFYDAESEESQARTKAKEVFSKIVEAPWMSSGLTPNNAFSTTLVLRTYGFLKEQRLLKADEVDVKEWDLRFGIRRGKLASFASAILSQDNEPTKYLYSSLSDRTRLLLAKHSGVKQYDDEERRELESSISLDLGRISQSGVLYSKERFPKADAATVIEVTDTPPKTGYDLTISNQHLLREQFRDFIAPAKSSSIVDIAKLIGADPHNFGINQYPASAAIVYWYVDAIARAGIPFEKTEHGERMCHWARDEFTRARSLVVAEHDAMMDPVAMAMAACLCARLRDVGDKGEKTIGLRYREILPSTIELEKSIEELFRKQSPSGIWPKYFPLFHYQEAGSNFCFTFELLEAILVEFGRPANTLVDQEFFVSGLERAVTWCERNRLKILQPASQGNLVTEYAGWNSGGYLETLKRGEPESWATAVVHMFLFELTTVLSQRIQRRVLAKYKTRQPKLPAPVRVGEDRSQPAEAVRRLQDISLWIREERRSLKELLTDTLIEANRGKTEQDILRARAQQPLSALLFGPPGTSKTEVCKAVADDLGWPLVEIDPSEFVKGSLANVYVQADEIFADMMDLSAVVVLFDEMDPLTQKREKGEGQIDTESQFLTTTMLPKLAALHDRGGVVFFMATNFQENFDSAIKRAGRFDLLLCMGPPILSDKIAGLSQYLGPKLSEGQKSKAMKLLKEFLQDSQLHSDTLELFTFGDFRSFLKTIGNASNIGDKLEEIKKERFRKRVEDYGKVVQLKRDDLALLEEAGHDITPLSKIDQLPSDVLQKIKDKDVGKYFLDRRESKLQY